MISEKAKMKEYKFLSFLVYGLQSNIECFEKKYKRSHLKFNWKHQPRNYLVFVATLSIKVTSFIHLVRSCWWLKNYLIVGLIIPK